MKSPGGYFVIEPEAWGLGHLSICSSIRVTGPTDRKKHAVEVSGGIPELLTPLARAARIDTMAVYATDAHTPHVIG
jgi:hypothetical protein